MDRAPWLFVIAVVTLARGVLAASVPLFGDEAFYRLEALRPAWVYSDVPGMTAWLIGASMRLFGDSSFAIRLPFVVLASLVPWQVYALTRSSLASPSVALRAAGFAALLPLAGTAGILAVPDVPMTTATLLTAQVLVRAAVRGTSSVADGIILGLAIAAGIFSHYRFGVLLGFGGLALLLMPAGRKLSRQPKLAIGLLGLLAVIPILVFNAEQDQAGLAFQFVERHPWRLGADGLLYWPLQWVIATPVFATLAWWACWSAVRKSEPGRAVTAALALAGIVGYGVFALVTDRDRISLHWPLQAWLLAMPAAAVWLESRRRWARICPATMAIGCFALLAWYALATSPVARAGLADSKLYPENFSGWQEVAAAVSKMQQTAPAGPGALIADNFMLAAQLDARLPGPTPWVLDHPQNHRHGRAAQLAIWSLVLPDQTPALRGALLVVEETALKPWQREAYAQTLVRRFGPFVDSTRLELDAGRKVFVIHRLGAAPSRAPSVPVPPG